MQRPSQVTYTEQADRLHSVLEGMHPLLLRLQCTQAGCRPYIRFTGQEQWPLFTKLHVSTCCENRPG